MTLPKKHRLPKILKKRFGKTIEGALFKLVYILNETDKRFAFVVSSKISKKAVIRNKIRRRLSEGIRELLNKIKEGDYIFFVKKKIIDKSATQVKEELVHLLKQNGEIIDSRNN